MANATVKDVIRQAIMQVGYCESPAGSNRTKFGKLFGMNGQPWCMIFEWWCGQTAKGDNPFPHSANAAYGQDEIVSQKGGKWILKKTASNDSKRNALSKVRIGDCVDFDFGANDYYRDHTALALGRNGDYYVCIEGNTSATDKGSQSNGGCVAIRMRKYTQVCAIARPKYSKTAEHKIKKAYGGNIPSLPKRGYFKKGDKGIEVKRLQNALNWSCGADIDNDSKFGNETLFGVVWFQYTYGLVPDGQFGKKCLAKLKALIKANKSKTDKTTTTAKKQTKAQKVAEKALDLAWAYKTKKSVYTKKPKPAYKKALDKVFPNRKNWSVLPRTGRSCDVFVATVMRSSGVDKHFPRGLSEQYGWLKNHPKLYKPTGITKAKNMKPGDIIIYRKRNGGGHICIYAEIKGKGYIVDAGRGKKRYGMVHIKAKNWNKKKYAFFQTYRIKG